MKITQKFFLFGLIPALTQIFICMQMFAMLGSFEFYGEKEAKQSLIDRKLVTSMSQLVEVAVAARSYAAMPAEATANWLKRTSDHMDGTFADLRSLTKDDPTTNADIEQLIAIGSKSKTQFLQYKGIGSQSQEPGGATGIDAEAFRNGTIFISRLKKANQILDRESAQLANIRDVLRGERSKVKYLVWAEIFVTLIFLCIMYLLFRYDFVKRFGSLLQLAQDLALDKPPSKVISGKDELAYLSKALIEAANARQQAVAQKQMLYQMVTHDLRSPLMAASLVIDGLRHDPPDSEEKRQTRLASVDRSMKRVIGLADDLLTIEKLSAGVLQLQRVRVDFKETLDLAMETVQALADTKQCRIANHSPSLLLSIDEDRILQVTVNLLANAIRFSPQGSVIDMTAAVEDSWLRVEIMDRGLGINQNEAQGLFNPFQQGATGGAQSGFGLGLAIAKLLVDLHGGAIGVNARPGGGSIFWYTLKL